MSKLKCRTHKVRVMVLPTGTVVHRKDGMACPTDTVLIKDGKGRSRGFTPVEVATLTHHTVFLSEELGK